MAKDPAFLFYPNDYIGGTMGMTFEEKGAYIELLMLQFNRGHMTKHMIGQAVGQIWDNIKDKFIQDKDGLWYNERLELEQNNRKNYTDSRRNNKSGNNQYTKKEDKKRGHMTKHMENENKNENIDVIIDRVYLKYPTKCVVKNSSTGKSKADKTKIRKLLKSYSESDLINKIDWYVSECEKSKVYMKNFSTFLNNLPDTNNVNNFESDVKLPLWRCKYNAAPTKEYECSTEEEAKELYFNFGGAYPQSIEKIR